MKTTKTIARDRPETAPEKRLSAPSRAADKNKVERRRYERIMKPMDAKWSGASVAGACRIADISLGGCFVQTLARPSKGERTSISIVLDGEPVTFKGQIAYVDPTIGFAMQFDELQGRELAAVERLIEDFAAEHQEADKSK